MRHRIGIHRWPFAAIALMSTTIVGGCHSFHVEVTVENRTGALVQLLEVDYPSASFGTGELAPQADYHYRIQLRGTGPLKIQYTEGNLRGKSVQITGPTLVERQEGKLEIVLLPGGKAVFHSDLTP